MVRIFIIKVLKLLVKTGILGRVVGFTYTGVGLSLNKFYKQGHWGERQSAKVKYRDIFLELLRPAKQRGIFFDKYYVLMFYNSKHDVDNVIGMEKVFTDTLKDLIVKNDTKQFFRGLMVFPDESLPYNTFEFILIESLEKTEKNKKAQLQIEYD